MTVRCARLRLRFDLLACRLKEMNVKEFARLGGRARAAKLTKERRIEIARNAGLASSHKRSCKQALDVPQVSPGNPNELPSVK